MILEYLARTHVTDRDYSNGKTAIGQCRYRVQKCCRIQKTKHIYTWVLKQEIYLYKNIVDLHTRNSCFTPVFFERSWMLFNTTNVFAMNLIVSSLKCYTHIKTEWLCITMNSKYVIIKSNKVFFNCQLPCLGLPISWVDKMLLLIFGVCFQFPLIQSVPQKTEPA
jgi:hypothetical protein